MKEILHKDILNNIGKPVTLRQVSTGIERIIRFSIPKDGIIRGQATVNGSPVYYDFPVDYQDKDNDTKYFINEQNA